MKTLIYLLTISLLIVSCEKNEVVKPEEKKVVPKIKHIRFYIVKSTLGTSLQGGDLTISGVFISKFDSLDKETKTSGYHLLAPVKNDTIKMNWTAIESDKTKLYLYVTPDKRTFFTRTYVLDRDSMTLIAGSWDYDHL